MLFLNEQSADFKRAKQILVRTINPSKYTYTFEGRNGTLILNSEGVIIRRVGALMGIHPDGEKFISYGSINAIQFRKPGFMVGFIQFTISGGKESTGGSADAAKDENSITFGTDEKAKEFSEAKRMIEEKIRELHQKPRDPQGTISNDLDSLEKLASLKQKGIITEEEFAAKKKQILGL